MGSSLESTSALPNFKSWTSVAKWRERVIGFEPSWFVLTMGTGVIVQLFNFFPWPSYWLHNLGYVFWILNIVLVSFFVSLGLARLILYPKIVFAILEDVQQTANLGAIPISFDTLITGIVLYYHERKYAMYIAEGLFWLNIVLATGVSMGGVFAIYRHQGRHRVEEVTGVWFLLFVPMIVTAALGSALVSHTEGNNADTILIVSFIMLSLGLGLSFIILTIFFWRLLAYDLPPRDAIVSCFVPVGPPSTGAFTILGLSIDLSELIMSQRISIEEAWIPPFDAASQAVVAQMIIWLGVIFAFMLLGVSTFFLIEAAACVSSKIPKRFNIGFWAFVFPCGVYAIAFCRLSTTLRNDGIKVWAAICVILTTLLWLMCALLTTYKGVWQGKVFVAPGLQGFIQQEQEEFSDLQRVPTQFSYSGSTASFDTAVDMATNTPAYRCSTGYLISSDGTYKRVLPSPQQSNSRLGSRQERDFAHATNSVVTF